MHRFHTHDSFWFPVQDFVVTPVVRAEPPLVTATPLVYASLPEVASTALPNHASSRLNANNDIQLRLGRRPTSIQQCPHCLATHVMTSTSTYPTLETWLMCFVIFWVFWPACWIPLVMDSAKFTDHICTHCGVVVGHVKPLSDCCVEERGWETGERVRETLL